MKPVCVDSARVARPLFLEAGGGSSPTSTLHARDLHFGLCAVSHAVRLTRIWHSRLPNTQAGPWEFAFAAEHGDVTYAVALWNTPSARCLPQHWLELRRLACAPDVPRFTPSRFLAWMVRWFRERHPTRERCISYQDTAVHTGTIYKAAGWMCASVSKPRIRDRSKNRTSTSRAYRSNLNGVSVDSTAKARWEITL